MFNILILNRYKSNNIQKVLNLILNAAKYWVYLELCIWYNQGDISSLRTLYNEQFFLKISLTCNLKHFTKS